MLSNDAEKAAYLWVGSAPCEDCDGFRECEGKDEFSCGKRKEWDNDYNKMVKKFTKLYEGKIQKDKGER